MSGSKQRKPPVPFPLPDGHFFSTAGDLRAHDGRNVRDAMALRVWQANYVGRWHRPRHTMSAVYNGHVWRAVREVQAHLGLPLTGRLGAAEWAAVWGPPPPGRYVRPKAEPPPRAVVLQKRREKWDKISKWGVRYGSDPGAPPWYPGRPFGQHEHGPHVRRVQEILGTPPHGRFTAALARRIRGWQRVMGLPVSGIVDVRTACLLDPPREEAPAV